MNLDRSLLKEFAKVVNDVGDKPAPKQYVYGTITTGEGNAKYVKLDGSDMLTPIFEVVVAEAGDRVLVSVENHQATVIGNITFPPSARKEDQAIESANGALNQSNQAMEKAKDAQTKASSAITDSSVASALANEAKSESAKAQENANKAIQNAGEAKQLAQASSDKSDETQQLANQVKDSVTAANKDISALKTEVKTANDNIASANTKLDTQAGEIATIKETYSTKVETETTKADLTTEISKQVGALQTTVEKNFATKTENVALEKKLQTQITQNADSISSTVTKVEKLQSDTTEQQKNIDKALQDAQAANTAAGVAKSDAEKAKTAADTAQKAADTATANATSAQKAADLANEKVTAADKNLQSAKTDLKEAQENLKNVTSRVDATEQEITDAKQKVDTANKNVTQALKDVAEANAAASKANENATNAQNVANTANKAASDAQTKAADAQKVANQASADASKAQKDLAALTNRVTKTETAITQTNEAITAQASKITETSNKIDGIQNDITNNYYSKEQTDAQIKVSTDKISQTVTETTKVVTSANKNASDALSKANSLTDRANKGEFDGRGVASTTVEYQASTSGTIVPTGAWYSTIPTVAQGSYLWTKTTTNYTSGTPTVGYSVARMGVNGAKGDKGETGQTGAQGPQGLKGDTGLQGPKGATGPQGPKGADGKSPTVSVSKSGNTTTITVNNPDGTKTSQTVKDGTNGTPGKDGATGKTTYFHVKYSNDGGKTFTSNSGETVGDYIGTYTDFVEADSTSVSSYTWAKIKGAQGDRGATGATGERGPQGPQGLKGDTGAKGDRGPQGIQGPQGVQGAKGADGKTYYTWIKYADSPTSGMSDSPAGKLYLGVAYNKSTATESTNYSDYFWSLIKGDKGDRGATGATGPQGATGATGPQGIKGDKGATGAQGPTGATGNGIKSIVYTYARTASQTAPAASAITSTTMPTLDATNKYLWQKEVITYTNNQQQTTVLLLAVYGDRGPQGATGAKGPQGVQGVKGNDGKGIKSTSVTYQIWSDGTTTPNGTWSSTPPKTTADKPYLWTRTVITYTDNAKSTSYSVGSTPEGIVIGGRNLIKGTTNTWIEVNTGQWYTNIIAKIKPIELYGLKVGDTVTFSVDINGGEHGAISRFTFYSDINGTTDKVAYVGNLISKGTTGKSVITHTITSKELYVELCMQNGDTTYSSNVIKYKGPKLEIGNKATDWAPAPEDQEQYVKDKIAASEKTTEDSYKALIDQTARDITGIVEKIQKETTDNSTTISQFSTNLKMTTDGLSATKSAITTLKDAVNGKVDSNELKQYLDWDGDNLILSTSANKFKCMLSNTELGFYQGKTKVAWISNEELYVLKAIIAKSIGCGNFLFVDEGDLGFSLI